MHVANCNYTHILYLRESMDLVKLSFFIQNVAEWTATGNVKQGWDKMLVWSHLALCTVKSTPFIKYRQRQENFRVAQLWRAPCQQYREKLLPRLLSSYTLKESKIAFMLEFWGWVFAADSPEQGLKQVLAQEAPLQPEKAEIALFSDQHWNPFDALYILMQLQTAVE